MHDIATMANLMRYTVFLKIRKSSFGFRPRIVPATSAARKQPDPVQVSQLKSNFAFSAVGFGHDRLRSKHGFMEIRHVPIRRC